jgi:acetyl-CoA carboxylase carboxyltransferase component
MTEPIAPPDTVAPPVELRPPTASRPGASPAGEPDYVRKRRLPSDEAPEVAREHALSPTERLEALCDPGSVHLIRSYAASGRLGAKAQPGDGVVGACATVEGRPVFCYAEDGRFAGGSLGEAHAKTIVHVQELAAGAKVPVIGFIESAGARMQEGSAALAGYARVFRASVHLSGKVPQISIVTGVSAGGGCYSPALTDFVFMTRHAAMFLTGPKVVQEVTGQQVTTEELGGAKVHQQNGVCQFVVDSDYDGAKRARELLSFLPQNAWERPVRADPEPPPGDNPGAAIPREPGRIYDVRHVASALVDGGHLFEVAPKWAKNIVVAMARIDGRPVGIVANQPRYLGGVLDAEAAQKAARFVRVCNAFNLPLVVLVDTPGFLPGTKQEAQGIIRHGAKLLHAFASATVPKISLVLRQAYGGGYITMNSQDLGADFAFAWPRAKIGIMGPQQAVGIIHRRRIAEAADPAAELERLAAVYADEQQLSWAAAREGVIDEILLPQETRARLCAALDALGSKMGPTGRSGNIPL